MIATYVLDTSVASLLFSASPALSHYTPYLKDASPVISFQTVAEMRYGALLAGWGTRRLDLVEAFLERMEVVGYSDLLATCWARITVDARKAGRRLEAGDAWIAATALHLGAPLLTNDADFDVAACPSILVYRPGV
jgi:predicted nucleic acid-binding protein